MVRYNKIVVVIVFISISIKSILSEWIEISHVKQPKFKDQKVSKNFMTTASYELFLMKSTQQTNLDVLTTPSTYLNVEKYEDLKISKTKHNRTVSRNNVNLNRKKNMKKTSHKNDDLFSTTTYEGFIPFVKMVQKKLLKNKDKSLYSKITVLTDLRDQLMQNLHNRISNLWGGNSDKTEARGYKEYENHEMDFPSNEGALMTIGFLTFAVFLIKLVLKLIYALKYKHNYYNMMTTTVNPAAAYIGRRKRNVDDEALRILQLIEEYSF